MVNNVRTLFSIFVFCRDVPWRVLKVGQNFGNIYHRRLLQRRAMARLKGWTKCRSVIINQLPEIAVFSVLMTLRCNEQLFVTLIFSV